MSGNKDMNADRAKAVLFCHNRWRRGDDDYAETDPVILGEAIDFAIQALRDTIVLDSEPRAWLYYHKDDPADSEVVSSLRWASGYPDEWVEVPLFALTEKDSAND